MKSHSFEMLVTCRYRQSVRSPGHDEQYILAEPQWLYYGNLQPRHQLGQQFLSVEATHLPSSVCFLPLRLDVFTKHSSNFVPFNSLNFVSFNLEQPNTQSVCNVDTFTVTGASGAIPVICGANGGQHSK